MEPPINFDTLGLSGLIWYKKTVLAFYLTSMQMTVRGLIVILGLTLFTTASASPVARVTALASTVWLHQGDEKRRLTANDELGIGDRIVTGENGRAEIQLWSDPTLRIYPGTEISIRARENSEESSTGSPAALYLQLGKVCARTGPPTSTERDFVITVADKMIAVIHQSAHICLSRGQELSSVRLREGSVEITSSIDQSILVLSEAGIELDLNDDGSYQLLPPTDPDAITEEAFIAETVETDAKAPDAVAINGVESERQAEAYVYTLYLFSTRSEDVANQVNERLQQAGHDTRILVNETESPARYRVAVPGFDSRQTAEEYAASIVGTLGIADSWIGKDRPRSAD